VIFAHNVPAVGGGVGILEDLVGERDPVELISVVAFS